MKEAVFAIFIAVLLSCAIVYAIKSNNSCTAKGGLEVRTSSGTVCAKLEPVT